MSDATLERYIRELFDTLMRTLPRADEDDDRAEIEGTPYESDRWILLQVAEFIVNSRKLATSFSSCRKTGSKPWM